MFTSALIWSIILAQEVIGMTDFQKMEQLAKADGGVLKTSSVTAMGISKTALAQFISKNEYERVSLGVYLAPDAWRDDAYLLQLRCPQVVFSHDSALFYFYWGCDRASRRGVFLYTTPPSASGSLNRMGTARRTWTLWYNSPICPWCVTGTR